MSRKKAPQQPPPPPIPPTEYEQGCLDMLEVVLGVLKEETDATDRAERAVRDATLGHRIGGAIGYHLHAVGHGIGGIKNSIEQAAIRHVMSKRRQS